MRPTVAIVGLGLVGGSLARALTRAGYTVVGVDRAAALRRARTAGAIAETAASVEAAAARSDLLVLAAPPKANRALLRRAVGASPRRLVITDVSSVKRDIVAEAKRLRYPGFVGGHPLAGNEGSGFGASSADLFRGCAWVLTPEGASPRAVAVVRGVARAVGARPATMTAADHDRALAFLSHVPQIVAWALLAAARDDAVARRALALAGPGFRDMTRLASSPRPLWREILGQNRGDIKRALAGLRRRLWLQP